MSTTVQDTVQNTVQDTGVNTTQDAVPGPDGDAAGAFAGRVMESLLGAMDLYAIHLGDQLGLYAALHEHGPSTSAELAARAGVAERYAREWLEQQAVTGILRADDGAGPGERRFTFPDALVAVLLDPLSPAYLAPAAGMAARAGQVFDTLLGVYRNGAGLPWSAYPRVLMELQAAFNRPAFTHDLGAWFAAVPALDARLAAGPVRVADVGCGAGWSSQAIARRYPRARVDGYDLDETSVVLARRSLAGSGVEDRVRFEVADLSVPVPGPYDAVTVFEALHDMSHPVEVLTSIRASLVPGGQVLVVDERAAESFTAPGDAMERMAYGSSLLLCLPVSLHDGGTGTGAAVRPSTVRRYSAAAGFVSCEVLDVQHDCFRFYLLTAPE